MAGSLIGTPNQVNGLATVGNKLTIEDVRINLGTVPLPNVAGYDAEMARCMRYYEENPELQLRNAAASTQATLVNWKFSVRKNANPTITMLTAGQSVTVKNEDGAVLRQDVGTLVVVTIAAGTAIAQARL